jgi:hypothetical protein
LEKIEIGFLNKCYNLKIVLCTYEQYILIYKLIQKQYSEKEWKENKETYLKIFKIKYATV